MSRQVYFGSFFHCLSFNESESVLNGFIAVEDGKVICKYAHTKTDKENLSIRSWQWERRRILTHGITNLKMISLKSS